MKADLAGHERIESNGVVLAEIIRGTVMPSATVFLTPDHYKQQVGFVVYAAGKEIPRHVHRPLERHIVGTSEILIVKKGRAEVDIYDDEKTLVATKEVRLGDIILLVAGGHGFRLLEDTVLMEVKQGPYTGLDEKERF